MPAAGIPEFLRSHKDEILRSWESRVVAEVREVELTGPALRDEIPTLLDDLAAWLAGDATPETSLLATRAFSHVIQRLDAGLKLAQVFREYRLLREVILENVLTAEAVEQERVGASGDAERAMRARELARLNAGLDVVLSQSIEQFVVERDRRAAEARASAESSYRLLFDSIDEGFCVIEVIFEGERAVDYRFLEVNPAFERQTGLANATGRRMRDLVPEHDEHWFQIYGGIARTGRAERFENDAVALGRVYDVYAFRVGAPEERRVAVLFNDVTARKRAHEALRASEEMNTYRLALADSLRSLGAAAAIHAAVTRTARRYFGADRCYYCEIEGGTAIIRHDDSRADLASVAGVYPLAELPVFAAIMTRGEPLVIEDVRTTDRVDESLRRLCLQNEVIASINVPVVKDGKPAGVLCITQCSPRRWTKADVELAVETAERAWSAVERARTIAALRDANERLVDADRRKNEFLAVLSHELRNPLSPILSSVYLLERSAPGAVQVRARQVIDRQARQMARLVDDLLDVTRISRGKAVLHKERLDLNAVGKAAVEDQRVVFDRAGVALDIVEASEPLWVDGDRTRIAQVIGNLLTNAAKFTPRGGKTIVAVERDGANAVVRVRDNGAGMSPETLEHVFEPFVQAAQTLERSRGGLGLGLALVKGLVEMHGGSVSARSEGEGRGAELVVTLPLVAEAEVAPSHGASAQVGAKHHRVLVIEDNEDAAEMLQVVLAHDGHDVTVAHSGPEGLAAARATRPDVILCDIGLPEMDGYAVARAIRADPALRHPFMVALSGYAAPEDVARSKAAGFDVHMAKPPRIEALESLLASDVTRAA